MGSRNAKKNPRFEVVACTRSERGRMGQQGRESANGGWGVCWLMRVALSSCELFVSAQGRSVGQGKGGKTGGRWLEGMNESITGGRVERGRLREDGNRKGAAIG